MILPHNAYVTSLLRLKKHKKLKNMKKNFFEKNKGGEAFWSQAKNAFLDTFDDILAGMADSAEKMFFPVRRHLGYPPTINSFVIEAIVVEESTFKLCKRQKCKFGLSPPLGISKDTSGQLLPGMQTQQWF